MQKKYMVKAIYEDAIKQVTSSEKKWKNIRACLQAKKKTGQFITVLHLPIKANILVLEATIQYFRQKKHMKKQLCLLILTPQSLIIIIRFILFYLQNGFQ